MGGLILLSCGPFATLAGVSDRNDRSLANWWPGILSLILMSLLSACGGKENAGTGELLDEFGLPEVDFGEIELVEGASKKGNIPDVDSDALYTNVYLVPPSFFSFRKEKKTNEKDPFGEITWKGMTTKEFFEAQGVVFGPGTAVIFGGYASEIFVRQTAEELKKVDAYFDELHAQLNREARSINVRIEIYEISSTQALRFLEDSKSSADHKTEWESAVNMTDKGSARFVTSITALSRSGQRTKSSDVREVIFLSDFDWQNPEKPKAISPVFQSRDVGTILTVEPQLTTEGEGVDLAFAFEHHSAPPGEKKVRVTMPGSDRSFEVVTPIFHAKKITSKFTLANGAVRIIGAWRPTGKAEFEADGLMHIAFLKIDVQPVFSDPHQP